MLCHDHGKAYSRYLCIHALCNAHPLGELQRAFEQDQQAWAKQVQVLLLDINPAVELADGVLSPEDVEIQWQHSGRLLADAELEWTPPDESHRNGRRGRLKRSKSNGSAHPHQCPGIEYRGGFSFPADRAFHNE